MSDTVSLNSKKVKVLMNQNLYLLKTHFTSHLLLLESVFLGMRLTMGKVITLGDSNNDEDDLMSKEMLEEMVKKRLKEVVVAKLQRQGVDLLSKGSNFKLNLISRSTGQPVSFSMVDLDRIDNCSVSRIVQHNGEELEQDWVRSPKELKKTHCGTGEDEALSLRNGETFQTKQTNLKAISSNHSIENLLSDDQPKKSSKEDSVTLDEEIDVDHFEVLPEIFDGTFLGRDEEEMSTSMDLDIIEFDKTEHFQPGFKRAFSFLSSLPR